MYNFNPESTTECDLSKLDEQQMSIVTSEAANILVVAGAGSGKTRVLTTRVRYLLSQGVQPHNIVAITFTNMAAEEMRERLRDIPCIGDAFIGTIHSFANKIYRNSGDPYRIMTEEEEQLIYEELLNKPKYKALTIRRFLQYQDLRKKAEACQIDENAPWDFLTPSERNVLYTCSDDFERIRKRDNIITFDELLEHATRYYESLGATIEHILVDEFQDIGTLEYKFISALNAEHYFFVGDDYQAIYGFKGGNVEIFKSLTQNDKFTTYYLTNNYRSCRFVIDLGEKVISQVKDRIVKTSNVCNTSGGHVTIDNRGNTSRITSALKADKSHWCDWFVLTRTNKEAYQLADLLDDENIDYCFIHRGDMTLDELRKAMKSNQVKIMTVHSAKGLESKKVILFGNFPVFAPPYMRNTDERKVMYVGITRAIETLLIFN